MKFAIGRETERDKKRNKAILISVTTAMSQDVHDVQLLRVSEYAATTTTSSPSSSSSEHGDEGFDVIGHIVGPVFDVTAGQPFAVALDTDDAVPHELQRYVGHRLFPAKLWVVPAGGGDTATTTTNNDNVGDHNAGANTNANANASANDALSNGVITSAAATTSVVTERVDCFGLIPVKEEGGGTCAPFRQ